MTAHIQDITTENAQALLIDESFKRPVLVDFWAEWCGPCKSLMPILEKLANEYNGQFLLAKVNADDQQMITAQFGVRSLPTVMVMKDGQPVDGFAGAQPESQIREMLQKYLPSPWDLQLQEAQQLMQNQDFGEASSILREAYTSSGKQADIALALAACLIELKRFDEARPVLDNVKLADRDAHYQQLVAQLDLAQQAKQSPEITALEEQLKVAPDDFNIMLKLAIQYHQQGFDQEALELLYTIVSQNLSFADGEAKKTYLDILAAMGKADPVAVAYQRKLYTLLY